MQASDIFTGYMIDSKLTVSAQELSDRAGRYDFDDLAPAVRNYYSVAGEVRSMPYQISQPVMVLNLELLAKARLTPEQIPTDLQGFLDTASVIKARSGSAGLSFVVNTWWNEQFAAGAGLNYCGPGNGVQGQPATSFDYANPSLVSAWTSLQKLATAGEMINSGTDSAASVSAFTSGKAAMSLVSSGSIGNIVKTGVKFAVKPFPISPGGGVVPGGNSLWVLGQSKSVQVQDASWQVAKYLGSTQAQVKNFTGSGYLPTTLISAQSIPSPTPQQQAMLDQLKNSQSTTETAGCHSGALGETRQALQPVLEKVVSGADAQKAFSDQEIQAREILTRYQKRAAL